MRIVREGPFADIFLALQAQHLFQAIGEHAPQVESSTYQPAFATFQTYASESFVLAVTRLLEPASQRHPLQSMPGVLAFLEQHADQIPVREPIFLQQSMERLGEWQRLASITGPDLTRAAVDVLLGKMPRHQDSQALDALKTLRDKRIAHPERVAVESLPSTTWESALSLLNIPTEALAVCGAHTSEAYVDSEGRLFIVNDPKRAGFATVRALRELGVIPPRDIDAGQQG
jgi:hypothetical protein